MVEPVLWPASSPLARAGGGQNDKTRKKEESRARACRLRAVCVCGADVGAEHPAGSGGRTGGGPWCTST